MKRKTDPAPAAILVRKGRLVGLSVTTPPKQAGFERVDFREDGDPPFDITLTPYSVELRRPNDYPGIVVEILGGGVRNLVWDESG